MIPAQGFHLAFGWLLWNTCTLAGAAFLALGAALYIYRMGWY